LRVTLSAADDKSANEIFLRHDAVPSSAQFDATYTGPLSSDLTAIVPSTEPGVYYLLVRNFTAPGTGVSSRLLAELLPWSSPKCTRMSAATAKCHTTIRGAQFHDDAIVSWCARIAEHEPLWDVID
jgi:hypothetical protein